MPTGTDQKLKLFSYFRPKKLGYCFSTRPHQIDPDRVSVVYQFSCTEVGCQATYIGHTACTLRKRSSQHKCSISAIHKHYINDHLLSCVPVNFSDNFIVLQNFPDICELRIAEAILIKKNHLVINVKYNEMYNSLNLYKLFWNVVVCFRCSFVCLVV